MSLSAVAALTTLAALTAAGTPSPDAPIAADSAPTVAAAAATPTPVGPAQTLTINSQAPNQTVLGNLTVVAPTASGWVNAYPCATPGAATSSSLTQFVAGRTTATFTAVKTGADAKLCIYNGSSGTVNILWDQVSETSDLPAAAPARIVDATVTAAGVAATINTGAPGRAVYGTLTAISPTGGPSGWTQAYPCADGRPTSSSSNYPGDGKRVANFVAVKADKDGKVCLYTNQASRLLFDKIGESDTLPLTAPKRVLDTRAPSGAVPPAGAEFVIDTKTPDKTILGNLTAVPPPVVPPATPVAGWAVAYPCAEGRPATSSVSFVSGINIANFVAVKADKNGKVCVYTSVPANLVFDQSGTVDSPTTHSPARLADTRYPDANYFTLQQSAGAPILWDLCKTGRPDIGVWINPGASAAQVDAVKASIAKLRTASGMPLVYKGTTTIVPTLANSAGQSLRGDRDIIAAFVPGTNDLVPGLAGTGGIGAYNTTTYYGYAVFNETLLDGATQAQRNLTYTHNLAHALGLRNFTGAAGAPIQVMHPGASNTSGLFGNGDLAGLAAAGARAHC